MPTTPYKTNPAAHPKMHILPGLFWAAQHPPRLTKEGTDHPENKWGNLPGIWINLEEKHPKLPKEPEGNRKGVASRIKEKLQEQTPQEIVIMFVKMD